MIRDFRNKLIIALVLAPFLLLSQMKPRQSIGISYQKIDIGGGAQLSYGRSFWKKWEAQIGVYYHLNALPRDDQNHVYHNRGWANTPGQHFGANLMVSRTIMSYQKTELFGYYYSHLVKTSFREKVYNPVFQNGQLVSYTLYEGYFTDPILSWENSLGVGLSTMLSKRIGFRVRGGAGFTLFYEEDSYYRSRYKILGTYINEFSLGYAIGLFYAW